MSRPNSSQGGISSLSVNNSKLSSARLIVPCRLTLCVTAQCYLPRYNPINHCLQVKWLYQVLLIAHRGPSPSLQRCMQGMLTYDNSYRSVEHLWLVCYRERLPCDWQGTHAPTDRPAGAPLAAHSQVGVPCQHAHQQASALRCSLCQAAADCHCHASLADVRPWCIHRPGGCCPAAYSPHFLGWGRQQVSRSKESSGCEQAH